VKANPYRDVPVAPVDPYLVEWERLRQKLRIAKRTNLVLGLPFIFLWLTVTSGGWASWRSVALALVVATLILLWTIAARFPCPHCGRPYMTFKRGQPCVRGESDLNLRCGHCGIMFGTTRSEALAGTPDMAVREVG